MSSYSDAIKGTEILSTCVMSALVNSTFDALVNMTVHVNTSFFHSKNSMTVNFENMKSK